MEGPHPRPSSIGSPVPSDRAGIRETNPYLSLPAAHTIDIRSQNGCSSITTQEPREKEIELHEIMADQPQTHYVSLFHRVKSHFKEWSEGFMHHLLKHFIGQYLRAKRPRSYHKSGAKIRQRNSHGVNFQNKCSIPRANWSQWKLLRWIL
jgi:hypothetical protein